MLSELLVLRDSSNSLAEYKIKRRNKEDQKQPLSERTNMLQSPSFFGSECVTNSDEKIEGSNPIKKVKKTDSAQNQLSLTPLVSKQPKNFDKEHRYQSAENKHSEKKYYAMNSGANSKKQSGPQRYSLKSSFKGNQMSDRKFTNIESRNEIPTEFSSNRLWSNLMSTTPVYKCDNQLIMVLPSILTNL